MYSKSHADHVSGAVFLIGLGVLFTPLAHIVGGFFPGILFVIGASAIARGVAEGQEWYNVTGGLGMIGLGLVFLLGFNLPLLLILLGLAMLFGYTFKPQQRFGQHQHRDEAFVTEKLKHDEFV
ncbi:MAG: hypothetical protein ABI835_06465 [Chloroflexota bacterium]